MDPKQNDLQFSQLLHLLQVESKFVSLQLKILFFVILILKVSHLEVLDKLFLVFVNKDQEFIEECLDKIPHAIPQLHGEEDTEFCSKFTQGFVKAVRVNEETDFEEINRNFADAKMLLLDSHEEGSYGGTGQPFNWDLIDAQLKIPFLLAGGIDTMNVERAISSVPCKGVDVSTGVESAPGIKDPVKVRSLIENVRRFDV